MPYPPPAHFGQALSALAGMCDELMPAALAEMRQVADRAAHDGIALPAGDHILPPWHVEYYLRLLEEEREAQHVSASAAEEEATGDAGMSPTKPREPNAHLELGSCLRGLDIVLRRAFGLSLVRVPAMPGELWHPTVAKLLLCSTSAAAQTLQETPQPACTGLERKLHRTEQSQVPGAAASWMEAFASGEPPSCGEPLGVLYLDLFPRLGKTTGAALYTMRVATRDTVALPTDLADTPEAIAAVTAPPSAASASAAASAAAAAQADCDVSALSALYLHLPAAALVVNLPTPAVGADPPRKGAMGGVGVGIGIGLDDFNTRVGDDLESSSYARRAGANARAQDVRSTASSGAQPVLLSPAQLTTLYHEMGHALHALLSRAPSHHFGGLRVAQDFVEAPSTLMERFVSHPAALAMWATDLHSGRAITPRAAYAIARAASAGGFGRAIRLQLDAANAMLDLHLHSASPPPSATETTAIFASLRARHTLLPLATEGAAPHASFVHLAPYGAAYYAYLFALSITTRVWRDGGFAGDALSGDAGRAWVELVLRHGGARHPRQLLQSFLGSSKGQAVETNSEGSTVAWASPGAGPRPVGVEAANALSRTDLALLRLVQVATPTS